MTRKLTTEEFIVASNNVHGNKYDYSRTVYTSCNDVVEIICPLHGSFQQISRLHLNRQAGCQTCARNTSTTKQRHTTEDFVKAAKDVQGAVYDYSLVEYINSKTCVDVVCKEHGVFSVTPSNHLKGRLCPICSRENSADKRRKSLEDYISDAQKVHGNIYDYSKVDYVGTHLKITIVCAEHGDFSTNASSHLAGTGCPTCGIAKAAKSNSDSKESFVEKSVAVHGDKYDYSESEYVRSSDPVLIKCPTHGDFKQTPGNHLSGQGCAACQVKGGYKQNLPGSFYVLTSGSVTKVGITNKNVCRRLSQIKRSSKKDFEVYLTLHSEDGSLPLDIEGKALRWLYSKYTPVKEKYDGSTESFEDVNIKELLDFVFLNTSSKNYSTTNKEQNV